MTETLLRFDIQHTDRHTCHYTLTNFKIAPTSLGTKTRIDMPPAKNNGRRTAAAPATEGFPPIPMDTTDPTFNDGAQDIPQNVKSAFLPYLALGFTVAPQTRLSPNSGLYALMDSFDAARKALNIGKDRTSESGNIVATTITQWKAWFNGKDYERLVWEDEYNSDGTRDWEEVKEQSELDFILQMRKDTDTLTPKQLSFVLQLANKEFGTSFQLGVIIEGFRGRINPGTGELEEEWLQKTKLELYPSKLSSNPVLVSIVTSDLLGRLTPSSGSIIPTLMRNKSLMV